MAAGWSVIPLSPRQKWLHGELAERLGFDWLSKDKATADQVRHWFEIEPAILSGGDVARSHGLRLSLAAAEGRAEPVSVAPGAAGESALDDEIALRDTLRGLVGASLADLEREFIEATIIECNGSIPRAARLLDVSPSTLYRKREAWERSAS